MAETVTVLDYGHDIQTQMQDYNEVTQQTSAVNVSGYAVTFVIERPDETAVSISGSILNEPGTDGWVRAIVSESDDVFNTAGFYKFQVVLSKVGAQIHSNIFGYDAEDGLDA